MSKSLSAVVFWGIALLSFTPWVNAPLALVLGAIVANGIGLPAYVNPAAWVKRLLAIAIIGLGFGVQLDVAWQVTSDYLSLMVLSIVVTLVLAPGLGRLLRVDGVTSHLIGSGTAICGGSAIALIIFPWLGNVLDLSQTTFGAWAAMAIHDTSSVVGAAQAYGDEALQTATTLKLARALWIIPLALVTGWVYQWRTRQKSTRKLRVPGFIIGYVLAMVVAAMLPQLDSVYHLAFGLSKQLLVFCLYLVGASITWARLRAAGWRPLVLAVSIWVAIGVFTLSWLLTMTTF